MFSDVMGWQPHSRRSPLVAAFVAIPIVAGLVVVMSQMISPPAAPAVSPAIAFRPAEKQKVPQVAAPAMNGATAEKVHVALTRTGLAGEPEPTVQHLGLREAPSHPAMTGADLALGDSDRSAVTRPQFAVTLPDPYDLSVLAATPLQTIHARPVVGAMTGDIVDVDIRFDIDADGHPVNLKIVHVGGPDYNPDLTDTLVSHTLAQVARWSFRPHDQATQDGFVVGIRRTVGDGPSIRFVERQQVARAD